jgi:hypothetical protein
MVSLLKTTIVNIDFGILSDYRDLELHPRSGMLKTTKESIFIEYCTMGQAVA